MKKIVSLLILFSSSAFTAELPEKSKFIGSWCSNPCYFDSSKRPRDLPCNFKISDDDISWTQWNDKSKSFSRKYELIKQNENEEVFLVDGGHRSNWYSHESNPDTKQELIFKVDHGNKYAKGTIKLLSSRGSLFIRRSKSICP